MDRSRENNISSKLVISNMLWRLAERFGAQGVNFAVSVVLARMLTPDDYGIVALATTFTTILGVFLTNGLGTALIQKNNTDDLDYSTALIANIVIGIVLYGAVFAAAPYIANYFRQPRVCNVLRVISLTLVIGGLESIEHTKISRAMEFKLFFKATLIGTVVSAVVGIWMAVRGFGVWAIVAQYLINQVFDTALLWMMIHWRPTLQFSWKRLKPLYSFGWRAYSAQMIETLYNSLRSVLIGRYYTSADLAFFNRGRHIPDLVNQNTNNAVQSVMFPAYTRVANNPERMKHLMRRATSLGTFLIFPAMTGLAMVSEALVDVLYTSKWQPAVPFLQIACFVYALTPMHIVNLQAVLAIGRSDISLKIEVFKKIICVTVMVICIHVSLMSTAVSAIPLAVFALIVNAYPVGKLCRYPLIEQVRDAFPSMMMSTVMGGLVWIAGKLPFSSWIVLLVQLTVGVLSYWFMAKLSNNKDYLFMKKYVYDFIGKFKKRKMSTTVQ